MRRTDMRTYLVAVVAHTEQDVQDFLLASPLSPARPNGVVDCWWIAEDDRTDGSDNDSATFVPRGAQSDVAHLINQWCEANAQAWREDGYPYAATDVSGVWFTP